MMCISEPDMLLFLVDLSVSDRQVNPFMPNVFSHLYQNGFTLFVDVPQKGH